MAIKEPTASKIAARSLLVVRRDDGGDSLEGEVGIMLLKGLCAAGFHPWEAGVDCTASVIGDAFPALSSIWSLVKI